MLPTYKENTLNFTFLACETTLPDRPNRRNDAFEFDLQFGQLQNALRQSGHTIQAIDWKAPISDFSDADAVVVGTPWNYQDYQQDFLNKLENIEKSGLKLYNSAQTIKWNVNKSYLKDLAKQGASTVPTLWVNEPTKMDIQSVFDTYDTSGVVVKRQIGAGAHGQSLYKRGDEIPDGILLDRPAMIQPFMPAIQTEGEYSYIFIDGEYSHALLKTAKAGDYRIQSSYGGTETPIQPEESDIQAAQDILSFIPFETPLYARIDLLRGSEGKLLLMELEMIEPYLYPVEGPRMSEMYAAALIKRASL